MRDHDKIDLTGFLGEYLEDSRKGFHEINTALLTLERDPRQTGRLDEIFRVIHTLKSSSVMLEFQDIVELAHLTEDLLDRLRKGKQPLSQEVVDVLFEVVDTLEKMVEVRSESRGESVEAQEVLGKLTKLIQKKTPQKKKKVQEPKTVALPTIEKIQAVKVNVGLLDALFDMVGELIITNNRINTLSYSTAEKELKTSLKAMGRMVSELHENISEARLVPVDEIIQKFPRMVRDLAKAAQKEVDLTIEGREIELDKATLDAIGEPLIHLLRNAVDHGIEPPSVRQKRKKNVRGTIKLTVHRAENHVAINVEDDGAGIDVEHMRKTFIRKGLIRPDEVETMKSQDILNLLFLPGFSGSDEVTDLSGRGVGLDVVKTAVERIGGTVEVKTQNGRGTQFFMKLPLTTAILQTMMVGIGSSYFAIPSDIVIETMEVKPEDIRGVGSEQVLVLRGEIVPFVRLSDALNIPSREDQKSLVALIVHMDDKLMGIGVDTVEDIMENIIKPFDPIAQEFKGFSGGTILGDGRVTLLLDIPTLFDLSPIREERLSA